MMPMPLSSTYMVKQPLKKQRLVLPPMARQRWWGTHTHIPTSDHRILPGGTAYQTDAGMCGDYTSVIGMNKEAALGRFTGKAAGRLEVAKGEATLCGVIVESDEITGLARSIIPFRRQGVLSSA